jgi:hypothetical protein
VTHTEHVHILLGIGLAMAGALWLGALAYPGSPLRYVWPIPLFLVGLFLVIPTETQERTYSRVSAWDTFLSVFPNSLDVWLASVRKVHVMQHKAAGICAMAAAGVEEFRTIGWLTRSGWRWTMPLFAIVAGLAVGVHGGTHTHLPRFVEQLHHWILGGALAGGGIIQALASAKGLRRPFLQAVLPSLVLLAGLDLALFYRIH